MMSSANLVRRINRSSKSINITIGVIQRRERLHYEAVKYLFLLVSVIRVRWARRIPWHLGLSPPKISLPPGEKLEGMLHEQELQDIFGEQLQLGVRDESRYRVGIHRRHTEDNLKRTLYIPTCISFSVPATLFLLNFTAIRSVSSDIAWKHVAMIEPLSWYSELNRYRF